MRKLVEINNRGTTVIVVTHEHELVREFGGRVIIIKGGAVERDDKIQTVYHPADQDEGDVGT